MSTAIKGKFPIDRPCSACSAGDLEMKYHDHTAPFREGYGPTPPEEVVLTVNARSVSSGEPPINYTSPEKKEGKVIGFEPAPEAEKGQGK